MTLHLIVARAEVDGDFFRVSAFGRPGHPGCAMTLDIWPIPDNPPNPGDVFYVDLDGTEEP